MSKRILLTFTLCVMLALGVTSFAQEESGNVVGDETAPALNVVQNFLASFDTSLLSENVQYSDTSWAQPYEGRENVSTIYQQFYNGVFTNVTTQPTRFIVSGDNADVVVAEYTVNGVNSGDYGMTLATGATVSVPTVSIFRVQDGMITEISTYTDIAALNQQLGIPSSDYVDPLGLSNGDMQPNADAGASDTTDMTDETQPDENMAEGDAETQGIPSSDEEAENMDKNMPEGETQPDTSVTEGEAQPDENVEEAPVGDTSAEIMPEGEGSEVELDTVLDDPEDYYEQRLTLQADLTDMINGQVFIMKDDDLIAADDLPVIYVGDDAANFDLEALADEDQTVRVTGTFRQFFISDFQNEFVSIDFSDEQFGDWEERGVLVADQFTVVDSE